MKLPNVENRKEKDYTDLIERIATRVVEWRMSVPAIVILESGKPLSFVASQVMVFFEPIVQSLFSFRDYRAFYEMLEDRENVERLIQAIERKEEEYEERRRREKAEKRRKKRAQ